MKKSLPPRLLGAVLAALFVLPGAASGAAAQPLRASLPVADREAALWYTQDLKFDEIRALGLTGKGVTIAVIDDAINLDVAELQGADIEVKGQFCKDRTTGDTEPAVTSDPALSHGTAVVSMLVGNGVASDGGLGARGIVPDAKVLFYAKGKIREAGDGCDTANPVSGKLQFKEFWGDDPALAPVRELYAGFLGSPVALAAAQALEDGADIISVSLGGDSGHDWDFVQSLAMHAGVPVVAGAHNPGPSGSAMVPYGLNGVVAVSGVDQSHEVISYVDGDGIRWMAGGSSNLAVVGPAMNMIVPDNDGKWEAGISQGTSLTTPLVAGTVALGMEKYPKASGFQVLQAMIRTTGTGEQKADPEWTDEKYGYGVVNPVGMLAIDPTQYPDVNPLFIMTPDDPPCGPDVKTMDACAADHGVPDPSAEEVWPNGDPNQKGEAVEPKPGVTTAAEGVGQALVWVVVGVLVLGVLAAAITIPIVVSRSRKKKLAAAATVQQGSPAAQQGHPGMQPVYPAAQQAHPGMQQAYPVQQQGYPVQQGSPEGYPLPVPQPQQPVPEQPQGGYPPHQAPPIQSQYVPQQPPNVEGEHT
ncbi:S8 family serine peptidase [Leucobacter coleopterorum]|uniref:S8 family serine peptidase n=1 Tax=Leucobacter coleopterorum TaxID=2714933 RepID=A0ABX6K2S6_9MICO|nr:S8/S53 family peptidase [Leucobacter coleopterorum]QIM19340.1 S8 family serine peptidase [Leucobacter coleopterorum]